MDTTIDHEVYQTELRKLQRGVPLYNPNPSSEYSVHVGDVGYLRDGQFKSVFNAFSNSDETSTFNIPQNLEFIQSQYTETRNDIVASDHTIFKTIDTRCEGDLGLKLWSSASPGDVIRLSVPRSKERAALLSIRDSAMCTSTCNKQSLERHMLKHYLSWLDFIQDSDGSDVRLQDMMFVTDCQLTGDWVTGVATRTASHENFRTKYLDGIFPGIFGESRVSMIIPTRYGPDPNRPLRNRSNNLPIRENTTRKDQCIFLKCFWIKDRSSSNEVEAEPQQPEFGRYADDPVKSSSMDLRSVSDKGPYEEPHEFALNTILQNSNAQVAIVHEADVIALSEAIGYRFVRPIQQSRLCYEGEIVNVVTEYNPDLRKRVGRLRHKKSEYEISQLTDPAVYSIGLSEARSFDGPTFGSINNVSATTLWFLLLLSIVCNFSLFFFSECRFSRHVTSLAFIILVLCAGFAIGCERIYGNIASMPHDFMPRMSLSRNGADNNVESRERRSIPDNVLGLVSNFVIGLNASAVALCEVIVAFVAGAVAMMRNRIPLRIIRDAQMIKETLHKSISGIIANHKQGSEMIEGIHRKYSNILEIMGGLEMYSMPPAIIASCGVFAFCLVLILLIIRSNPRVTFCVVPIALLAIGMALMQKHVSIFLILDAPVVKAILQESASVKPENRIADGTVSEDIHGTHDKAVAFCAISAMLVGLIAIKFCNVGIYIASVILTLVGSVALHTLLRQYMPSSPGLTPTPSPRQESKAREEVCKEALRILSEAMVKPMPTGPKTLFDAKVELDERPINPEQTRRIVYESLIPAAFNENSGDKCSLDLLILLDATASMGNYIESAKKSIIEICSVLRASGRLRRDDGLQVGLVAYRDYPEEDNHFVVQAHPFTYDLKVMEEYLAPLEAIGGGDLPEAFSTALDYAYNKMEGWRDEALKAVIVVTDAAPHGLNEDKDDYPNGVPDGEDIVDPLQVAESMAEAHYSIFTLACEPRLGKTTKYAIDFYKALSDRTFGRFCSLVDHKLLPVYIIGALLERIDLRILSRHYEAEIRKQIFDEHLSLDEVIDKLHEELESKGQRIINLQTGDMYSDLPEAEENYKTFIRSNTLADAKAHLRNVNGSRITDKSLKAIQKHRREKNTKEDTFVTVSFRNTGRRRIMLETFDASLCSMCQVDISPGGQIVQKQYRVNIPVNFTVTIGNTTKNFCRLFEDNAAIDVDAFFI